MQPGQGGTPLFHTAPTPLAPGSIILPGNWGRIISRVGSRHQSYVREMTLEEVRQSRYPDKPSRLAACFACETLETAQFHAERNSGGLFQYIYRVTPAVPKPNIHRANFHSVEPWPGATMTMQEVADAYWQGGVNITVQGFESLDFMEVVIDAPLRILDQVG